MNIWISIACISILVASWATSYELPASDVAVCRPKEGELQDYGKCGHGSMYDILPYRTLNKEKGLVASRTVCCLNLDDYLDPESDCTDKCILYADHETDCNSCDCDTGDNEIIEMRGQCTWWYQVVANHTRYPEELLEAYCCSDTCASAPNCKCEPVYQYIQVYRKSLDDTGSCVYTPYIHQLPVACICALSESSSSAGSGLQG